MALWADLAGWRNTLCQRGAMRKISELKTRVLPNHARSADDANVGRSFRGCLDPHRADVSVEENNAHVGEPPGGVFRRRPLDAARQVRFGIHPQGPSKQVLGFALGSQREHVTELTV